MKPRSQRGMCLVKSTIFSHCLFIPRWGSKTFLDLRQQCESSRLKRAPRFIDWSACCSGIFTHVQKRSCYRAFHGQIASRCHLSSLTFSSSQETGKSLTAISNVFALQCCVFMWSVYITHTRARWCSDIVTRHFGGYYISYILHFNPNLDFILTTDPQN